MAIVVNARDVILQAALPSGRVAGVTMQPNIAVDPSQVTGLGLIIDGTRLIDFESSAQVFQVNTAGTATPSSITLTINFRNVTGTPSLTVTSGTLTSTPTLSGGPTVYTATLPYANMSTDAVTIRASVTYASITYTDDLTIVKARDGQFAVNAFLTNESHTVPSSDTGVVSSYTGAGGTFKVYQGSTDVSTSCTYAVQSNPNSLTTSINSTSGVFSVTGGFGTGIDTATVTYRATFGAQTFDKIFTITKSKAGATGSTGQRGSRTFYVSGITSWSDATATSTASVSGGPVINDVVTQYDTSAGFSQTRFWNGSAWVVVNAVVDGNLLVSGTVGASKIAANAIQTQHLLVQGGAGLALNGDPGCLDATAWVVGSGNSLVTLSAANAVSGLGALQCSGGIPATSLFIPAKAGATYKLSFYAKRVGTEQAFARVLFFDAAGNNVNYLVTDFDTGGNFEGFSGNTTWTFYRGYITAGAASIRCYIQLYGGYAAGGANYHQFQEIRLEEQLDSSLVVAGGLRADRIDTRNLTIKDSGGTVIFSAGTNLDYARVGGTTRPADNATSDVVLVAKGTGMTVTGNTAAKTSGSGAWDAGVYTTRAYTGGAFAEAVIHNYNVFFGLNPDPLTGSSNTTLDYSWFLDAANQAWIYESNTPVSGTFFTTWVTGDTFSVTYDGSNVRYAKNGVVFRTVAVAANLVLYFDSSFYTPGISTLRSIRHGPYGSPSAVAPNNPINSGNVSTYIANVAIQDAQIATLNADKLNAGSIRGINVNASSHTTLGSYLVGATSASAGTLNVKDTTDFPSSGSGVIFDTTNDRDAVSWTGKTSTTLTGCSGVLAHTDGATIIPLLKAMVIDAKTNEMRFFGDDGTGTIAELASIGIRATGSDQNIAVIGEVNSGGSAVSTSTRRGIFAAAGTREAVFAQNYGQFAAAVWGVNFYSPANSTEFSNGYGIGIGGYGSGGGPGVYGVSAGNVGGFFDAGNQSGGRGGSETRGHLMLRPTEGRPLNVQAGQLSMMYTTGGTTDARTATPRLMYADGTNWRKVADDTIWAG